MHVRIYAIRGQIYSAICKNNIFKHLTCFKTRTHLNISTDYDDVTGGITPGTIYILLMNIIIMMVVYNYNMQ